MSYKSPINLKESRNRNKRQLKLLQSENSINALPFNLPVLSSTQMERMSIIANSKLKALAKEKYFGRYSPQEDYNNLAQRNSIDKTIESKQVEIKIKRTEVARNSAAFLSSYLKSMKKEHSQDSIKLDKVESNHEYRNNYRKTLCPVPPKRPRSVQFWEGDWTKGISVLDILIYLLIFFYLS